MAWWVVLVREEVELWIEAAKEDLYDAELAISNKRWFRAAFYSQQAVEKAFKALYMLLVREPPPYTHRVTVLYSSLREKGFKLPSDLEEKIAVLNKYYTITRYPDAANGLPSESVDREEAIRALEIARRVVGVVEDEVRRHRSTR